MSADADADVDAISIFNRRHCDLLPLMNMFVSVWHFYLKVEHRVIVLILNCNYNKASEYGIKLAFRFQFII